MGGSFSPLVSAGMFLNPEMGIGVKKASLEENKDFVPAMILVPFPSLLNCS
jgi:hypothetical protein